MKWGAFKRLVKAETIGELSLPAEDDTLKDILLSVIAMDIASFVVPTVLLEQDRDKADMLYPFPRTDNFFIRRPMMPTDDDSEIDLDDSLCYAAVYFFASKFVKDAPELNKKATKVDAGNKALQNYLWGFAEYLESKGICDDLSR